MKYSEAKECINDIGRKEFEKLIKWLTIDAVESAIKCGISAEYMEESHQGAWDSDEEFTQELLESCGEIPSNFPWYICIDWESTAINIMQDYVEEDEFYWRL